MCGNNHIKLLVNMINSIHYILLTPHNFLQHTPSKNKISRRDAMKFPQMMDLLFLSESCLATSVDMGLCVGFSACLVYVNVWFMTCAVSFAYTCCVYTCILLPIPAVFSLFPYLWLPFKRSIPYGDHSLAVAGRRCSFSGSQRGLLQINILHFLSQEFRPGAYH